MPDDTIPSWEDVARLHGRTIYNFAYRLTGNSSPVEIYERERRDPRIRFVTRERLQGFIDALALN